MRPDSHPYTEDYDYLSDSDLEDGSHSGKEEEELQDHSGSSQPGLDDEGTSQTITPDNTLSCPSPFETTEVQDCDRSSRFPLDFTALVSSDHSDGLSRMGRVAIIRDIGATTYVRHRLVPIGSLVLLTVPASRRHCISFTRARSPLPR